MKKVLVIGASSAIAHAVALQFLKKGAEEFFLVARSAHKLKANAESLKSHGAKIVNSAVADLVDFPSHKTLLAQAFQEAQRFDVVVMAQGELGNQSEAISDFKKAHSILDVNYTSYVSLCDELIPYAEQDKVGTIAVISSVAGDRGRASNFLYGSAKSALNEYLSGLRAYLFQRSRTHVLTVKCGFVDTPMTAEMKKGFLWAQPSGIARSVVCAVECRSNVIYAPSFWRYIMMIIKAIPEPIFKKLKF